MGIAVDAACPDLLPFELECVCVPSEGGRPPGHTPLHRFRSRQKPTDCRELPFDLTLVHMQAPCTQRGRSCVPLHAHHRHPPLSTSFITKRLTLRDLRTRPRASRGVTRVGAQIRPRHPIHSDNHLLLPSTLCCAPSACALRGACYLLSVWQVMRHVCRSACEKKAHLRSPHTRHPALLPFCLATAFSLHQPHDSYTPHAHTRARTQQGGIGVGLRHPTRLFHTNKRSEKACQHTPMS
jgi:hypothetical protein